MLIFLSFLVLLTLACDPLATPPAGKTFYVSPSGSDANDGLSPASAWRTVERVNTGDYQPGDRILFEGGQTFDGLLQFTPDTWHGTAEAPITISSYGSKGSRATLTGGVGFSGVGGASIEAIDLAAAEVNTGAGIFIFNESPATVSGFRVADVKIVGFPYALLAMTGDAPAKIQKVHLERVIAHDNGAGPTFFGHLTVSSAVSGKYGVSDVYVGYSEIYNNSGLGEYNSGYGLAAMNAENVVIERNIIHDNGGDNLPPGEYANGPSAITIYDARNVVIQRNEIYGQRRDPDGPTDNGGIDMWATDSLVQHNYVHDNEGWGMILGAGDPAKKDEPFPWLNERNTIRYNIFEDNARRLPNSPIPEELGAEMFFFGPVKDFEIYHNTFYARNAAGSVPKEAEQGMMTIVAVPPYRDPQGLRFRNNIFIAEDRVRFIELPLVVDVRFENNAYIGGVASKRVQWGWETFFDSIDAWSSATGQEQSDGAFVAKIVSPEALCAPGQGRAEGYRLAPGSPLIDAGADLPALGIKAGFTDFFGNPVPYSNAFDIGAHEWQAEEACR